MEVAFLLCDGAQASEGKLYMLGGGWRFCGPAIASHAVVALMTFGYDEIGDHEFVLELVDEDGRAVVIPTDAEEMKLRAEATISVVEPQGSQVGQVIDVPFIAQVPAGLPLRPGGTYVWQLWIDGNTRDDWRYPFYVRPAAPEEVDLT